MKKKILLIGNNDGLPGVQQDFLNYTIFFKSEIGGNWYDSEILSMMNPTKEGLLKKLRNIRNENNNYVIVVFSGHAGLNIHTDLELNKYGETISENELYLLSTRQLTILDCCRSTPEVIAKSLEESLTIEKRANINYKRQIYDKYILRAIPQQAVLYACSESENSGDTGAGGLYSVNLLQSARAITDNYQTVGETHQKAIIRLEHNKITSQHPDHYLVKCKRNEELIFSFLQ
ncbi:MAG: caspase family protein [Ignavibacteriaceae bacterium]